MEKYIPDIYQKSIYKINYDSLMARGLKFLLFDLDNTIAPPTVKEPYTKTKKLFENLKAKGFTVIIFSNSPKIRVRPFAEELEVDYFSSAMKPFKDSFLKALEKCKFQINETAIIGDQLLTDIAGGNKVGITTILVDPIDTKDHFVTRFNRFLERKKIKKLRKKALFSKERYYE